MRRHLPVTEVAAGTPVHASETLRLDTFDFAHELAHQLRIPLTPIVGALEILLEEDLGALTVQQRRLLESVERSAQRLGEVAENLISIFESPSTDG